MLWFALTFSCFQAFFLACCHWTRQNEVPWPQDPLRRVVVEQQDALHHCEQPQCHLQQQPFCQSLPVPVSWSHPGSQLEQEFPLDFELVLFLADFALVFPLQRLLKSSVWKCYCTILALASPPRMILSNPMNGDSTVNVATNEAPKMKHINPINHWTWNDNIA